MKLVLWLIKLLRIDMTDLIVTWMDSQDDDLVLMLMTRDQVETFFDNQLVNESDDTTVTKH